MTLPTTPQITIPKNASKTNNSESDGGDLGDKRFLENVPIPIDYVQLILLVKMLKSGDFPTVMEHREKVIAQMVSSLAESGAGNIVTAWTHSHLIAQILEHNYFVRKGGAKSIIDGANWITGALTIAEIFGAIAVPAALVFSGGGAAAALPAAGALGGILGKK